MEIVIENLEGLMEHCKKLKDIFPNDHDYESYYKKVSISIDKIKKEKICQNKKII